MSESQCYINHRHHFRFADDLCAIVPLGIEPSFRSPFTAFNVIFNVSLATEVLEA
jgi:hypothetical protein